jgi:hypothetical protein
MYQNVNAVQRGSQSVGPRPQPQQYVLTHDFDGTATLAETVVHGISGAANADVSDVEAALARQVDPSALNQIFRPSGQLSPQPLGTLSLSVLGYTVSMYTDGQIVITPRLH